jgi:TolB-like protein
MSADPEQEYFSDGLTDDLITDLAKLSGLFVIARNSVFTYKGQAVKVVEVGQELGVRHVLEGSVRKVGNRVRINAQLIDAVTGGHAWAERYDRELEDLFALQDEIRQKIVFALKVTLTPEEQARFRQAPTPNLDAYDDYLRGREYFVRLTKEANTRARQLFESALKRDPTYAAATAFLGATYWQERIFQWNPAPEVADRAFQILQEAVGLDPSLAQTRMLLGWVYMHRKQYEEAQTEIEHARALAPNFADCYWRLGVLLDCMGQPEKGLGLIEQALRLNPHPPLWYVFDLGWTYYLLGRHDEARSVVQRVLKREPHLLPAHVLLAAIFSESGYEAEARAEVAAARQVNPHFSLEIFRQRFPLKDPVELARFVTALRNAGLE